MKKNKKSEESGFIPRSWKLVKIPFTNDDFSESVYNAEKAEELASGVADYFVTEENGENVFVYTNGKRIFELRGKEKIKKKLLHTDFCIKLGAVQVKNDSEETAEKTDFFNIL